MEKNNYNINIEIVDPIGNYGDIICKPVIKSFVDDYGDIQSNSTYVFNIMLKDGTIISDEWFDTYEDDCYGNCIIGFIRTNLEYSQLMKIPVYCSEEMDMLCEPYTYRYGAINSKGILSVQPIYDRLTFNNEDSFIGYHNGKLGYIDSITGKHITPIVFSHAQPFFENKAAVEFNGQMGYVDRNKIMKNPNNKTEYAIEPKYDIADDFENGYAEVSINGQDYLIDKNGNICPKMTNQEEQLKKIIKNNKKD